MEPAVVELAFPKRPQKSEKFKTTAIKLISNHFKLSLSARQPQIYLYEMKILNTETNEQIPADARRLRVSIIRAAHQQLSEVFSANYWHSGLVLWSIKNNQDQKTFEARVGDIKYVIALNKRREISLKPETFQNNETAAEARQYLNVLIKRYFKERGFVEWGINSKYYDPEHRDAIERFGLEIYTGYKTSCEAYQNYIPRVLIDFASKIIHSDSLLDFLRSMSPNQARDTLIGRSVITSYGNYMMWRIDDIDYNSRPTSSFERDNRNVSYVEYYRSKYNINIKDLNQPLLLNIDRRTNKRTLLIPELVQLTGLDDEMRSDFHLMTEVAKYTRLSPGQRMQRITGATNPLSEFFLKQYGITMEQQSFVDGHVLPPPRLTLGNGSFVPDRGNYQLREPVFRPATFSKWLFVYAEICKQEATSFLKTLDKCAGAYAIKVGKPLEYVIKSKSPEELKETIRTKLTPDTQIVVCMYPVGAKKFWYKALKDVCYKEKGVPCQAVVSASLKKNEMSVCSKILLQMNAKIGLELWITEKPAGLPEKTMIIGADVFHNTKIGQERKSCIGFCASLNPDFSKFFSKVSFQNKVGEEIMTSIGKLVKEAILKYFAFNGKKFLPECIIFFRDGVAENQLRAALNFETQTILDQIKTIDPNYTPKFAEIIITKRIDDRLFATEGGQRGGRGGSQGKDIFNPPAGTLVAETIVSNHFDYLLVSQNVTQGTCTPTRFNVIYDTTGLSEDVFWQLSYSQSYNYYNWNGSVRVPAPVQYAHKLAYLVGQSVQGDPHNQLDQTLYYL